MFYVAAIYLTLAIIIFAFFIPFPKDVGLVIKEHVIVEQNFYQELAGELCENTHINEEE